MEGTSIDSLYQTSARLTSKVTSSFHRYLYSQINWENWLIAIKGARGVGKTTMLLQYVKEHFSEHPERALYVSLDNLWFANRALSEVVEHHYTHGGTHIFIDEIHKYPNWQTLIKNIADEYPDMHVVYTGSSMLKMDYSQGDLSRRVREYTLSGLSFREFLAFEGVMEMETVDMDNLLQNHVSLAMQITGKVKVLSLFERYLVHGYYPFYQREADGFNARLQQVVRTVLNEDIPAVEDITFATIQKLQRMLMILAERVPQTPKMNDLYAILETNREQGLKMLSLLERAGLLVLLSSPAKEFQHLSKPDKIYLNNPNLMAALTDRADTGTMRETFFLNQLKSVTEVSYPKHGDFLVNRKYIFEVGGKSKNFSQIKDIADSYLAVANTEIGHGNRIPLWMFGLLY